MTVSVESILEPFCSMREPVSVEHISRAITGRGRVASAAQILAVIEDSTSTNPDMRDRLFARFSHRSLVANTGVILTRDGLYVQDRPAMQQGLPVMPLPILHRSLKTQEGLVAYSSDRSVRFTPSSSVVSAEDPRFTALFGESCHCRRYASLCEDFIRRPHWNIDIHPVPRLVELYIGTFVFKPVFSVGCALSGDYAMHSVVELPSCS